MMNLRRWLTIVFFALTAVSLRAASPADDAAEAIIDDFFGQLDRVIDVLKTVKDEDSADKAAEQLKVIEQKLYKIRDQIKTAQEPSQEEGLHMMDRLKKGLPAFGVRLGAMKEQLHAAGPAATATVTKSLGSIFQALQSFGTMAARPPQPAGGN